MKLLAFAVLALLAVTQAEEGARTGGRRGLPIASMPEPWLFPFLSPPLSSAALDVELSDDSFPPEDFGIVSGMLNVKWDRIAPYPLDAGRENSHLQCRVPAGPSPAPGFIGFTSAPGQGGILAQREFDRRFSPHFLDWAAFGVMTLPSIGIPLLLWYSSKRKYDTPKARKN
ncbi:translocon-associated protein subunit beta [Pteropus medius]|uniref:translocon-associated protein subunit beta n=1 Tax=Pteropus vampyrus TaxID=132908 RepID=UPI00196A9DFD|nr:translocon-associated protein subunit beta [Pteropus giganteus]